VTHEFAPTLSQPFVAENFHFYSTVLRGATAIRPRWKRVLDMQENALGDALGQLFVKEYFKPEAKARYDTLVKNVVASFADHIKKADWMSAPTKVVALDKLHKITPKVGYPDKWKDYSALTIDRGSLAENVMRANQWRYNYELHKLGRPVDRTEWNMTPQTYNAYYNPSNNEIVLPAASFAVPGLLDADADDALVYGYAGASTIGHELTHGFDDDGRQFDAKGNLKDWWTKKDAAEFEKRTTCLTDQYGQYIVVDDVHINSKLTLGEDLADFGGLVLALIAWKAEMAEHPAPESFDGLTPDQRFFIGNAQWACANDRPEQLRLLAATDPHSPDKYRVNGVMANFKEFEQAFACKPGQPMAPVHRCHVW